MKEFKIRASAGSRIMAGDIGPTEKQLQTICELTEKKGSPKGLTVKQGEELNRLLFKQSNPELPAGAKSYCEMWLKQQLYTRKKEFTSKQTEKGNLVESDSIEIIKGFLKLPQLSKNDEYFDNEYCHGTPDIVEPEFLIDVKNSWDCFTFPLFDDEVPYDDNYWQGQIYMALTGKPKALFIYTLIDTPEPLIKNEAKSYCWKNGVEMSPEIMEEVTARLTYPDVAPELKIKQFEVLRNDSDIARIEQRVKMCRSYIKTLMK